jgi:hypothetical protein
LISPRIPFMHIRPLPRGRQLKLFGGVVNVPTGTAQVQTVLPQTWGTHDIIRLKLKRRLWFKGCYKEESVRPTKILEALRYLCQKTTLWPSVGVQFNENWFRSLTSLEEDEETSPETEQVDHDTSGIDTCSGSSATNQGEVDSDEDWSDV